METQLRADVIGWLRDDPVISAAVNLVDEAGTGKAAMPWLAVVASASADWSSKTHTGREIRIALELRHRGDVPGDAAHLLRRIEGRLETLPADQAGYRIANARFLRARTERGTDNGRTSLIEYRFYCLF